MKRFLILCLALWLCAFAIPTLAVKPWKMQVVVDNPSNLAEELIDSATEISLYHNDEVIKLPLDEYLAGVVAAEIPASFPVEAMKAQVVAARTYTMNRASLEPSTEHKGAMVCSNYAHCKAYTPIATAAAKWGNNEETYINKIRASIRETDGEILLYDNKPISAVFFAYSAGKTERAADVWGSDVPYLQSVDSSTDKDIDNATRTVSFPSNEFIQKFKAKYPDASFGDDPATWFTDITRSDAGGVMTLKVGGVPLKGTALRSNLGLRSTNFSVTATKDEVTFETRGYGHGVGMSQYGAKGLADNGKNYQEILTHYYKGVNFGKISK